MWLNLGQVDLLFSKECLHQNLTTSNKYFIRQKVCWSLTTLNYLCYCHCCQMSYVYFWYENGKNTLKTFFAKWQIPDNLCIIFSISTRHGIWSFQSEQPKVYLQAFTFLQSSLLFNGPHTWVLSKCLYYIRALQKGC